MASIATTEVSEQIRQLRKELFYTGDATSVKVTDHIAPWRPFHLIDTWGTDTEQQVAETHWNPRLSNPN